MKKALFLLAALLISGAASAQTYVGMAGGPSKHDFNCSGTTDCDTSDIGFKAYLGFKFIPMLAGELTYTDFGKVKGHAGSINFDYGATSFSAGVAVLLPLAPQVTFTGRLGVASVKSKPAASLGSSSFSDSETNTRPYYGLGIGVGVTSALTITGDVDLSSSEYRGEKTDARLVSVGLRYAF